ncbi:MAG: flagellar basal body P-ring formation protein FlgA [Desulfovibrionales bacterium]|jgi:flagella basal body P-ring formation protein FlgA|nr:flagellar basal body P-ring formation protein FlgA [Desulfovibrionales bacterium]
MSLRTSARKALVGFAACLILLAGAVGTATGLWNPEWRLVVRSAACVKGDVVRLGDVAVVHGEMDPDEWSKLSEAVLWQAPGRGEKPQVVDRNNLKRLFIRILGDVGYFCVYPDRLTIQRGGDVVDQIGLRKLIVDYLTPRIQALQEFRGDVELTEFSMPEYVFLDDRFDKVEIDTAGRIKPGRVPLRINVVNPNGDKLRQVTASVFVNVYRPTPVAVRPLNRGDQLTPDLVTYKRKNLAYLADSVWDGKGGPWRLTRSIGTSQVIYASSIESKPKISSGDKILLKYLGKHIQLSVPAKALADGRIGDVISVQNLQSNREVLARVQDSETVVTP